MTRRQLELLKFIANRHCETGVTPSYQEMMDALGLRSKSYIHRLVVALEERGMIRRIPDRARCIEIIGEIDDETGAIRPIDELGPQTSPAIIRDVTMALQLLLKSGAVAHWGEYPIDRAAMHLYQALHMLHREDVGLAGSSGAS